MAKYKRDKRKIDEATNLHIPWGSGTDEGESSQNVTIVQFAKDSSYKFIKQQLHKVLRSLGCSRDEAKSTSKAMFPEFH